MSEKDTLKETLLQEKEELLEKLRLRKEKDETALMEQVIEYLTDHNTEYCTSGKIFDEAEKYLASLKLQWEQENKLSNYFMTVETESGRNGFYKGFRMGVRISRILMEI